MKTYAIILVSFFLAFSACKPDDPEPGDPEEKLTVTLSFLPYFKGENIDWTKEYVTETNDTILIEKWKFLLSSFTFEKADGKLVTVADQFAFLDLRNDINSVKITGIPLGDYKSIRFQVGLDSAVNHGNPAQWPTSHPLSPARNGMHWGWSGGYVFNVLEGYYRSGSAGGSFSYHVATLKYARMHSFILDYKLDGANENRFTFFTRLDKHFKNIITFDPKVDGTVSHSGPNDPVMGKFIQNTNGLFDQVDFR